MRKIKLSISILLCLLLTSTIAFAAGPVKVNAIITGMKLFFNGKAIKGEVVTVKGATYIPTKVLSDNLGFIVNSNSKNKTLDIYPNSKVARIKVYNNGQEINMTDNNGNQIGAIINNGTIYLPVKSVSESLGKTYVWNGKTSSVYLGKIDGKTPVENLTKLHLFKGHALKLNEAGYMDNTGTMHHQAALISETSHSGTYLLNAKYSRIKGNVSLYDLQKNTNVKMFLSIYGDDKLIYSSNVIQTGSFPQDFDVDVTGVLQLRIQTSSARDEWNGNHLILSGLDLYN